MSLVEIGVAVAVFLGAVTLLVVFHELGHFLAARWCGVPVLRFSVGLGKVLYRRRFTPGGTEFVLSALPLGGYVAMLDENEFNPRAASGLSPEMRRRAFNRQPVARRSLIAAAGPVFNLIFAVLAYTLAYSLGVPGLSSRVEAVTPNSPAAAAGLEAGMTIREVEGREVQTWQMTFNRLLGLIVAEAPTAALKVSAGGTELRTVQLPLDSVNVDMLSSGRTLTDLLGMQVWSVRIGSIVADGPAARGGLQVGGQVVAAAGRPVRHWGEFKDAVSTSPAVSIPIRVVRAGQTLGLTMVPAVREDAAGGRYGWLGVGGAPPAYARESYPVHLAVVRALQRCVEVVRLTLNVLVQVITGEASLKNFSGPIGIAQISGQAAQLGMVQFLQFLALLSLGLAVFNLLPIPVLDGGHLMYDLIEVIKGSPVSPGFRRRATAVGMALLSVLFVLICYHDIMRLFQ